MSIKPLSLTGYLAKQQTSGAPSRSRTHVWPSKCAANGSARPDMASGMLLTSYWQMKADLACGCCN